MLLSFWVLFDLMLWLLGQIMSNLKLISFVMAPQVPTKKYTKKIKVKL